MASAVQIIQAAARITPFEGLAQALDVYLKPREEAFDLLVRMEAEKGDTKKLREKLELIQRELDKPPRYSAVQQFEDQINKAAKSERDRQERTALGLNKNFYADKAKAEKSKEDIESDIEAMQKELFGTASIQDVANMLKDDHGGGHPNMASIKNVTTPSALKELIAAGNLDNTKIQTTITNYMNEQYGEYREEDETSIAGDYLQTGGKKYHTDISPTLAAQLYMKEYQLGGWTDKIEALEGVRKVFDKEKDSVPIDLSGISGAGEVQDLETIKKALRKEGEKKLASATEKDAYYKREGEALKQKQAEIQRDLELAIGYGGSRDPYTTAMQKARERYGMTKPWHTTYVSATPEDDEIVSMMSDTTSSKKEEAKVDTPKGKEAKVDTSKKEEAKVGKAVTSDVLAEPLYRKKPVIVKDTELGEVEAVPSTDLIEAEGVDKTAKEALERQIAEKEQIEREEALLRERELGVDVTQEQSPVATDLDRLLASQMYKPQPSKKPLKTRIVEEALARRPLPPPEEVPKVETDEGEEERTRIIDSLKEWYLGARKARKKTEESAVKPPVEVVEAPVEVVEESDYSTFLPKIEFDYKGTPYFYQVTGYNKSGEPEFQFIGTDGETRTTPLSEGQRGEAVKGFKDKYKEEYGAEFSARPIAEETQPIEETIVKTEEPPVEEAPEEKPEGGPSIITPLEYESILDEIYNEFSLLTKYNFRVEKVDKVHSYDPAINIEFLSAEEEANPYLGQPYIELYKGAPTGREEVKKMIWGDMLHHLAIADPYWEGLRDEYMEAASEDMKEWDKTKYYQLIREGKEKRDFHKWIDVNWADAYIRGGLTEDPEWVRTQTSKQKEILEKMKTYLETGTKPEEEPPEEVEEPVEEPAAEEPPIEEQKTRREKREQKREQKKAEKEKEKREQKREAPQEADTVLKELRSLKEDFVEGASTSPIVAKEAELLNTVKPDIEKILKDNPGEVPLEEVLAILPGTTSEQQQILFLYYHGSQNNEAAGQLLNALNDKIQQSQRKSSTPSPEAETSSIEKLSLDWGTATITKNEAGEPISINVVGNDKKKTEYPYTPEDSDKWNAILGDIAKARAPKPSYPTIPTASGKTNRDWNKNIYEGYSGITAKEAMAKYPVISPKRGETVSIRGRNDPPLVIQIEQGLVAHMIKAPGGGSAGYKIKVTSPYPFKLDGQKAILGPSGYYLRYDRNRGSLFEITPTHMKQYFSLKSME